MLTLSLNGIKDLVQKIENPNGYILQVLDIQAVDSASYKVKVSDGFGSCEATFVGKAAGEIKNNKIFENSIVQFNKYEFDRAGEAEAKVILVSEVVVVRSKVKKVIGFPMNYSDLKELDFRNPSGSNKLEPEDDAEISNIMSQIKTLALTGAANFSFSFIAGLCAAYFVKKIVRAAAFIAGGFFFTLQVMAYNGLVTIHWNKFKPARVDFTKLLRIMSISSGGFGFGFYLGVRKDIRNLLG